jgi:hypothetical protein
MGWRSKKEEVMTLTMRTYWVLVIVGFLAAIEPYWP